MTKQMVNRISGILGSILALTLFITSSNFPDRAASATLYIHFLSIVLGIFSVILVLQSLVNKQSKQNILKTIWVHAPKHFFAAIICIIVYAVLLQWAGFFLSSFLFMIALAWFLGYRKILVLTGSATVLLLFIYFVFVKFLTVPVPLGLWEGVF